MGSSPTVFRIISRMATVMETMMTTKVVTTLSSAAKTANYLETADANEATAASKRSNMKTSRGSFRFRTSKVEPHFSM